MITQELIAYVRAEFNKGKTRDEINKILLSGGGWSESDINEVFREVIPMQSGAVKKEEVVTPMQKPVVSNIPKIEEPKLANPLPDITINSTPAKVTPVINKNPFDFKKYTKSTIIFLLIIALIGGGYFYRAQAKNIFNSLGVFMSNLSLPHISLPSFGSNEQVQTGGLEPLPPEVPTPSVVIAPVNCGLSKSSPLDTNDTIATDGVYKCMGDKINNCTPAYAKFENDLFPTNLSILKEGDDCRFEVSYPLSSTLTSVTGNKLAGQSLSCPIGIVKSMDEQGDKLIFTTPDNTNLGVYAKDVYIYGSMGIFLESDFDKNKIRSMGCSGLYMDSVIDSYKLSNFKN